MFQAFQKKIYRLVGLLPIVILLLGGIFIRYPYFLVPFYEIQTWHALVNEEGERGGSAIITYSSKGAITANYPINIHVKFNILEPDIVERIKNCQYFEFILSWAHDYPIRKTNDGQYIQFKIQLDKESFEGRGTFITPYSGDFSDLAVVIDGWKVWEPASHVGLGPYIFQIEGYSTRAQIINNNKNTGFGIISLGFALAGYLWKEKE